MTVLIAIAVKPPEDSKPYILMGSDSLKVNLDKVSGEEISRDENADKIFVIGDKLVGYAGRVDMNFHDAFIEFISENDCEISELANLCFEFVKGYISNEERDDAKCHVLLGSCQNSMPKIASISVKKSDFLNAYSEIIEPDIGSMKTIFAGSIKDPDDNDLSEEFLERVNHSHNRLGIRMAATTYLKRAARRYPRTCNQNIKFERLF